jgi:hypothetical protein
MWVVREGGDYWELRPFPRQVGNPSKRISGGARPAHFHSVEAKKQLTEAVDDER